MRSAPAFLFVLALAWRAEAARADIAVPWVPPRGTFCRSESVDCHASVIGFTNDEGVCVTGWDGLGDPPDAGGSFMYHSPRSGETPTTREERHVRVELPIGVYASLALTLIVGVAMLVRAARKRP